MKEAIDGLRKRFNHLRNGETFERIGVTTGVFRMRLSNFASGAILKFEDLQKIEDWCDEQERTHGSP